MTPEQAWSELLRLEGQVFKRWTVDGATGEPFTFRLTTSPAGASIRFLRNGIEAKSASSDRFKAFFQDWSVGSRDPDSFRNEGELGSKARVIHFLLPVFEGVTASFVSRIGQASFSQSDLRALMDTLTTSHIDEAVRRVQAGHLGFFAESTKFDVQIGGSKFPPKRVVGLALEALTGRQFSPYDFKGGELSACFQTLQRLGFAIVDKAGIPLGIRLPTSRRLKHGRPTWQLGLDAVHALGGKGTVVEVTRHVLSLFPDFNVSNVEPDLHMLSVNSYSRGNFSPNEQPRRSDEGNPYDALFVERTALDSVFSLYQPSRHGIWELAKTDDDSKLRPRLVAGTQLDEVEVERAKAEEAGEFNATDETDARRKIVAAIVRRQGQGRFRDELLNAYGGRCAITEFDVVDALEAAHIRPYRGQHTNVVNNGLLLRADIHTLFDLGLLWIDSGSLTVRVATQLRATTYAYLENRKLRLPLSVAHHPSREALAIHAEQPGG